jgi:hypothetical protein
MCGLARGSFSFSTVRGFCKRRHAETNRRRERDHQRDGNEFRFIAMHNLSLPSGKA